MTQKNLTDLKSEYTTNLANNDTGAISAQDVRDALVNTADSIIPIIASGERSYYKNRYAQHGTSLTFQPSGDLGAFEVISTIGGQWAEGKYVAGIKFESGSDNTNKDDGGIGFYTASSGNLPVNASGATWPKTMFKRAQIRHDGTFEVKGSGAPGHIGIEYNRIHGNGLGLLVNNTNGNHIASPDSQTMRLGTWNSSTNTFSNSLMIHGSGAVIVTREGGNHPALGTTILSSGWADFCIENRNNRNAANNNNMGLGSRVLFKGFKDASLSNSQSMYALGTDIRSSGNSSIDKNNFFIQDLYAKNKPHRLYIDPSGNIGIGNVAPSGKLHITAGGIHSGASGVALSLGTEESATYFDWKLSKPATESNNTYLTLDSRYPVKKNIIAIQSNSTRNSTHVGFGTRTPRGLVEISHGSVAGSGLNLTNTGEGGRRWTLLSTHGAATPLEAPANKASGCFVVQDSTASRTRFAIDASGNVGIGEIPNTIKGTATKALVFGDNGQNVLATNLNTAGLFAKDTGGVVKLYAFDEGGNQNAISPHVFKMFDQPDEMAWSYYGINHVAGREINVDVYGAIKEIENLTGKQFIFTQDINGE
jgi:hypothetical protein